MAVSDTTIYSHAEFLSKSREAILQTLDRKVKGIYLSQEAFKNSKWGGIPLIFAQGHPNDIMLMTDPEKALADVKGRFVGTVKSSRIEIVGHPRLMGMLDVTDDEVNTLIDEGKISLSTSMFANNTQNLTKILPTHVLLFIENSKLKPGDEGSWILNLEQEPYGNVEYADPGYQTDKIKRYPIDTEEHVRAAWSYINVAKNQTPYSAEQVSLIKARIISAAKSYKINIQEIQMADPTQTDMKAMLLFMKEHPDMVDEEMKTMMKGMMGGTGDGQPGASQATSTVQADQVKNMAEIDTLTTENEALKSKVIAFEAKEAENLKHTQETRWQTIKKSIPIGLTHKAEDEQKLRTEFETNPAEFIIQHIAEFKYTVTTPKEGVQFTAAIDDDETKATNEAIEELRQVGGMNRRRGR
jgi:hypothetical protein